jgi:uncharacterized protein YggL (DUF469 family)
LAASTALDAGRGPELALLGWSLAHGLSNLLIDGAFDGLPMELPAGATLAAAGSAALGRWAADVAAVMAGKFQLIGFSVEARFDKGLARQMTCSRLLPFPRPRPHPAAI